MSSAPKDLLHHATHNNDSFREILALEMQQSWKLVTQYFQLGIQGETIKNIIPLKITWMYKLFVAVIDY